MGPFTHLIRRPSPSPTLSLPLGARSVAHVRFDPGAIEDEHERPFMKLMWSVEGIAEVQCGRRRQILEPRQIVVFPAGSLHFARAQKGEWEVRWWTLDGPQASTIASAFGLNQAMIFDAGDPPASLFEQLDSAIRDVSPAGELRASAVAYELLCHAAVQANRRSQPGQDDAVRRAQELIQRRLHEADLGIESLAAALNTHRSSLSRQFQTEMGLSPTQYVRNLRMQKAMLLLKGTTMSIAAIGRQCGFDDPGYFARLFQRIQGMTPRTFRKSHGA